MSRMGGLVYSKLLGSEIFILSRYSGQLPKILFHTFVNCFICRNYNTDFVNECNRAKRHYLEPKIANKQTNWVMQ